VSGAWQVDEGKADAVRMIFRLAADGRGTYQICGALNRAGVAPISGVTTASGAGRKRRGLKWVPSYVSLILRNRAVIGEHQPHVYRGTKRVPAGEPLPHYYPAVVSEADFHRVQEVLDARRGRNRGRGSPRVANLFTGLLFDARDGCTLVTVAESGKCLTSKLVSSGGQRGANGSKYRTFPYTII
jgi:hypothetical protein